MISPPFLPGLFGTSPSSSFGGFGSASSTGPGGGSFSTGGSGSGVASSGFGVASAQPTAGSGGDWLTQSEVLSHVDWSFRFDRSFKNFV